MILTHTSDLSNRAGQIIHRKDIEEGEHFTFIAYPNNRYRRQNSNIEHYPSWTPEKWRVLMPHYWPNWERINDPDLVMILEPKDSYLV